MSLVSQIDDDINAALRGGEHLKLEVLRMVKSALKNQQIAVGHELSDEEATKVLAKEASARKEAAIAYKEGGRAEQAAKEEQELAILEAYLPEQMSDAELGSLIDATIKEVGAVTPADMGKVMGALTPKIAGKAEGSKAAALVRDRLAGK